MAELEFRFLGDFDVRREGRALALPPSRKTRALLAYLSLQPRRFSREHLCQLLWEVPDDPRGSLRWSLSKLRGLLDDDQRLRVQADRNGVGVDTADMSIDILELRQLVAGGMLETSTAELEAAAARYRGNVLEGLDFSNFHDFHAWCVAEREQSLRERATLLNELVRRLSHEPERALPHVRALVGLSPYEEGHRANLIRLLNAARQFGEAEDQYQLGLRMLKEAGIASAGELVAARRPVRIDMVPPRPASAPATVPPQAAASPGPAAQGLIGRQAEAAWVSDALDGVTRGRRCAVLLLSGVPGIGKSEVLKAVQAMARLRDAKVMHAAAFESEVMRPFGLWLDALQSLQPGAQETVFGAGDKSDRERLFAGLNEFVARQLDPHPLIVLFDDVQWCDESSAAALHFVARTNRDRPALIVMAARGDELRDNAPMQQALRGLRRDGLLRELELGPLPAEEVARLVETLSPGVDGQQLSRECGGNPLLAIELARAVHRGGVVGTLGDLVRERLAQCGEVTAEVLRWSAVLSARLDVGRLIEVAALDAGDVGRALDAAQRHALLQQTDRGLGFAHELIARAVYNDISPLRRQVMHRRVAQLLEKDTAQDLARAADLAHHAALSGSAEMAARAMVRAGRLCLRFFANDDAQSLARKGLQLAAALPESERVCVEIDLHDVLLAARPLQDREAAARQIVQLAERALDHGEVAHARLGYHIAAWIRWTQGQSAAAREQQLQAMRAVRGGNAEQQIVGMAEAGKCLVLIERDISQADAMLMEASALAQRRGFSHQAIAAGLGMLRFHENRLEEAEGLLREARILCKSAGDRVNEFQANEYLVMLDLQRGRLVQARETCDDLLTLGDKLRGGSEEPFGRAMAALCRYAVDDSAGDLEAALEDLRIADAKHRLASVLTRAALVDCERGRLDAAGQRADEALGYAQLLERPTEQLLAQAVLAHRARALGDPAGAARWAQEAKRTAGAGPAVWAQDLASRLSGKSGRRPARETMKENR